MHQPLLSSTAALIGGNLPEIKTGTSPTVLKGASLAHRQMTSHQRIGLLNRMVDGTVVVTPMTTTQALAVLRVSPFAVYSDRHRWRRNADRVTQLMLFATEAMTTVPTDIPTIEEIGAFLDRAGIDRVWDVMAAKIA
jgi:hypothetical protein